MADVAILTDVAKYHLLFDNMVSGFAYHKIIIDGEGKPVDYEFLAVNKAFENFTGLRKADILGKKVTKIYTDIKDLEFDWIGIYGKVALTGESITFEQYFVPLERWYFISAYCPQKYFFAVTFEDITARKLAEYALLESERKYRSLFENYENGVFMFDPETMVIIDANPAMTKIYGFSYEKLVGMNCLQLSSEIDESIKASEVIRRNGKICVETRWHKKMDGTVFPVELKAFFSESSGRAVGYTVINDLTVRKRVEDDLRKSEEKYRKIFYEAQVALFRTRISDGKLLDANEEYAHMAGYSTIEECKANFNPGKAWVDKKLRKKLLDLLATTGTVRDYEAEILRGDGKYIWVSFCATVYPKDGYIEGSMEDITRRKNALEQLKDMNTALDVLLKKREQETQAIEENIFSSYELMITPFLNKLKNTYSNKNQQNLVDIIETNLQEITHPFVKGMSNSTMSFTQSEIHIATMIKQGLTNKEIAEALNCSKRTIDTHRENIRKKLDLTNKKVNLKTFLLNS